MRKIVGASVIAAVLGTGCFMTKSARSDPGTNDGEEGFGRNPRSLPPPGQPSLKPE